MFCSPRYLYFFFDATSYQILPPHFQVDASNFTRNILKVLPPHFKVNISRIGIMIILPPQIFVDILINDIDLNFAEAKLIHWNWNQSLFWRFSKLYCRTFRLVYYSLYLRHFESLPPRDGKISLVVKDCGRNFFFFFVANITISTKVLGPVSNYSPPRKVC